MARTVWTGSISFGLVNVPVRLYSAVRPKSVRFHQISAEDGARVRQKRVSEATGEEVAYEDIQKGYEISPGRYVVIEPEELEALDPEASRTIDIEDFVSLEEIDPVHYDRPYYLGPYDETAAKPYRLLVEAMAQAGRVAIGRFVMRTKQYLAAIRVVDGALVLSTMHYHDEVLPLEEVDGLDAVAEVELRDREVEMAGQLVDSLTTAFEPQRYRDEYRERVLDLIEAKAEGEEIVTPAPAEEESGEVVDLMAALEESLEAARQRQEAS
jgi:DNA end-binding protein Ku